MTEGTTALCVECHNYVPEDRVETWLDRDANRGLCRECHWKS